MYDFPGPLGWALSGDRSNNTRKKPSFYHLKKKHQSISNPFVGMIARQDPSKQGLEKHTWQNPTIFGGLANHRSNKFNENTYFYTTLRVTLLFVHGTHR
jgi:hypothetical protein